MKRFTGIILVILAIGLILPNVLANDNNVVITYGETTYNNQDYKNIVDIYFSKSCPIHEAEMECINADEVKKAAEEWKKICSFFKSFQTGCFFICFIIEFKN